MGLVSQRVSHPAGRGGTPGKGAPIAAHLVGRVQHGRRAGDGRLLHRRVPAQLAPNGAIEIVGTDIGIRAIQQAKAAVFDARAMRLAPESYRRRFFAKLPTPKAGGPDPW